MKINKVKWRNFNSYGNELIEIDFLNDGQLSLITGKNAHGKSTIAEVITFALYGRVQGKNKSSLPNRINQNLYTEIEVESMGKHIRVVRCSKPEIFEIYVNNKEFEIANNRKLQSYLEDDLLEIPFNIFKNIIVLSVNDFKSFLTMSPHDKRDIIDRLFGFSIINDMITYTKNIKKDLKSNLDILKSELSIINDNIENIKNKINIIESEDSTKNKELIIETKNKIEDIIKYKNKLSTTIDKINIKYREYDKEYLIKNDEINSIKYELKNVIKNLKLYESNKCPTCNGDLNTDEHIELKKQYNKKQREYKSEIEILNENLKEYTKILTKLKQEKSKLDGEIIKLDVQFNTLKADILKISQDTNSNINNLKTLALENITLKNNKDKISNNVTIKYNYYDEIENILGDNGIKNVAISSILPILNGTISEMLNSMKLRYEITFNDKFDCVVRYMSEEIHPNEMSTGERKKADFVIILSLLKILKMKYPTLNLIFLDEIFSSIDSDGIYKMTKILNEFTKEHKYNTFLIVHREMPLEFFDYKYNVIKDGIFSKINIEKI